MIRDADVVVIGSGGFGAATAYFLTRRGSRRVALVDRHSTHTVHRNPDPNGGS